MSLGFVQTPFGLFFLSNNRGRAGVWTDGPEVHEIWYEPEPVITHGEVTSITFKLYKTAIDTTETVPGLLKMDLTDPRMKWDPPCVASSRLEEDDDDVQYKADHMVHLYKVWRSAKGSFKPTTTSQTPLATTSPQQQAFDSSYASDAPNSQQEGNVASPPHHDQASGDPLPQATWVDPQEADSMKPPHLGPTVYNQLVEALKHLFGETSQLTWAIIKEIQWQVKEGECKARETAYWKSLTAEMEREAQLAGLLEPIDGEPSPEEWAEIMDEFEEMLDASIMQNDKGRIDAKGRVEGRQRFILKTMRQTLAESLE
jgi:hypothetical protein